MMTESPVTITDDQKQQFDDQGFFVLPAVIPPEHLQMLREASGWFVDRMDARLDEQGVEVVGITHKRKRYFIGNQYRQYPAMADFIYSPLMAEICRATMGDRVWLFNEQWVIKGADVGMKFAWHQDSGYITSHDPTVKHKPYLSCWCALDDVDERNGTVYILPHERAGTKETIFGHTREAGTNDLVGYTGDDPGIPVIAPAGSIAVFSSFTFHRSGSNSTSRMRRVYLAQYSAEEIRRPDGSLWGQAVPFIQRGENVYDRAADFQNVPPW